MSGMAAFAGFVLAHYAAIGLIALVAFVLGRRLARAIPFAGVAEEVALATGLGLGAFALLIFALGALGILRGPVVAAALLVAQLPCWPEWRATGRRLVAAAGRLARRPAAWAAGVALGAVSAPLWLLPLYPPISFDATMYHLPVARGYVERGALVLIPESRFPAFPQLNEMLFALTLLFADDITAQLVQALMAALVALLLWAWGRRLGAARAGAWAAAVWLAQPLVLWLGASAYIDIGLTLFVTASACALSVGLNGGDRRWLVLAGAFAGFAAGAKYTGLAFVILFGGAAIWRRLQGQHRAMPAVFLTTATAVAAPWYVRNMILTGDPFHPFLSGLVGGSRGLWDARDVRSLLGSFVSHGLGHTPRALLFLPWNLVVRGPAFGGSDPLLVPAYLLVGQLLIVLRLRDARIRVATLVIGGYTLVWFAGAQSLRYLVPVLPLFLLAAAIAAESLLVRAGRARRRPQASLDGPVALAVCCLLLAAPGWFYAGRTVRDQGRVPVTRVERDAYLARWLPLYPAYRMLNARHGSDYSLYALYAERMAYFAEGAVRGDWFGPARYRDLLPALGDGRALHAALTAQGADHFLVTRNGRPVVLPDDPFFRAHFAPVYADEWATVYALAR